MNKKLSLLILLTAISTGAIAQTTSPGYVSKTSATVSIAPRDNLVVATTVVNWDTRASDTLAVDWVAPKASYCRNSQFVLSRGNNTSNDESWAYRTVIHTNSKGQQIVCAGNWVANVVNVQTHQVLASAGYTVVAPGTAASNS